MDQERIPVVWITSLDTGGHILSWHRALDGTWWAHVQCLDLILDTAWSRHHGSFVAYAMCVRADDVQPRAGWDYSRVPRTYSTPHDPGLTA